MQLVVAAGSDSANAVEWKWSTESGTGYQSTTPEPSTGYTYTPVFASQGTYYVVCEATYEGQSLYTEEVTINVMPSEVTVEVSPSDAQTIGIGEDGTQLTVSEDATVDSREWMYSTTSGEGYQSFDPAETGENYTPNFAEAGTYYVICESTLGDNTFQSNEVEITVSALNVEVTPADAQSINIAEDGTQLTVSESGDVDSREWKYSTTSGEGYQSFDPAETGETYTPNFAEAGTYYVICESTVGDNTYQSNEVEITVGETAINNVTVESVDLYPNPTSGQLNIEAGNLADYKVEVINMIGKVVVSESFDNASGIQSININQKGIYLVKIYAGDAVKVMRVVVK